MRVAMEGLSDSENGGSFSDVELKEIASAANGAEEILIGSDVVKKKPQVSFKTVANAVSKFLGVPDERKPAHYDVNNPAVISFVTFGS